MKHTRIIVTHYGGPDALRLIHEECPEPKPGEVRVRVLAAGVALPDVMAREGIHPETPPVPFTPGWDLVSLAGLEMYGTSSSRGAQAVSELGGIPIDYQHQDFVKEIHRLTSEGVDAVFDPIGGAHLWHSRKALRRGGRVVGYGNTTSQIGRASCRERVEFMGGRRACRG